MDACCAFCNKGSLLDKSIPKLEKILSEKLDDLKGAEARYSKDLTLCRAKVEEFQISETDYESLCEIQVRHHFLRFCSCCKYCTSLDRFQSCHDFILVEYNCLFGLVGLSLHVTEFHLNTTNTTLNP
jgi:hypothetical protein